VTFSSTYHKKSDGKGPHLEPPPAAVGSGNPEETVRQHFFVHLKNEYGYRSEQMKEEESVTGRGSGQARADFIIWRTIQDKGDQKPPLIIVECKSDNVTNQTRGLSPGRPTMRMPERSSSSHTTPGKHASGAFARIACQATWKRSRISHTRTPVTARFRSSFPS